MKQLLLLSLILGFALNVSAQKIKSREFDKFTKVETTTTSKETLYTRYFLGMTLDKRFKFYIRRDGNTGYTIFAEILNCVCEKYDEHSGIKFLLSNGEVVDLPTRYTGISKPINNEWVFSTAFLLNEEDVLKLRKEDIEEVRITTIDSYYDIKLKDSKKDLIRRMLLLFE